MVQALLREMELQQNYLHGPLTSVYFGGGTPSVLEPQQIQQLLQQAQQLWGVETDAEITLEANPDDLSLPYLQQLRQAGINRLSIGIQSFQEANLRLMNRSHTAAAARAAIPMAREAGFEQLTADLIYGVPGNSLAQWQQDLEELISYQLPHISAYCLTVEPNTAFGRWQQQGKFTELPEEQTVEQYEYLVERLQQVGYEQYEVSNFALLGFRARHNSTYWHQQPYLGIGPGAHSFNTHQRQYNLSHNTKYIKAIEAGAVPATVEQLSATDLLNEYLLTRLRLKEGFLLRDVEAAFKVDLLQLKKQAIEQGVQQDLLQVSKGRLSVTHKGRLLTDHLAEQLTFGPGELAASSHRD